MFERRRKRGLEGCEKEMESKSGWRLWIADVALWDFGRGQWCLSPALAGWHRGESEVNAPQRTAHKTPQERRTHRRARQPGTALWHRKLTNTYKAHREPFKSTGETASDNSSAS